MKTRVTRGIFHRSPELVLLLGLLASTAVLAAEAEPKTKAPKCSTRADEVRLNVRVLGVAESRGNVTITVYPDQSDRFLAKGGKLARQRVAAVAPVTGTCFVLPAAGTYAVAVYHDANDDHDFNRTFVGMPDEGFGFSRDPKTSIGLPGLAEVRFAVKAGDNPMPIKLTYP